MIHSFQPKATMCMACAKRQHDCSGLPFSKMPPLHTYDDGVTVVKCLAYERPHVTKLGPTLDKQGARK